MTQQDDLAHLSTELHRADLADLDVRSTRELVALVNAEDATVAAAVAVGADALAQVIDAVVERLQTGGRLIYAGAGTSGMLAALDAAECGPTFGTTEGQVIALVAGGGADAVDAEDDAVAGAADVDAAQVGPKDAFVALSASGRTPYTVAALEAARRRGALTVAVVCAAGSTLESAAEHAVVAVVGPEVVAGSTRLKAGTAQKLILNTISTVTMIRLGKTYGNLMVDVRAGNEKLRARARRAVALATEAQDDAIDAALAAADGDAKVAIVSLLLDIEAAEARSRLDAADGAVRRALEYPWVVG